MAVRICRVPTRSEQVCVGGGGGWSDIFSEGSRIQMTCMALTLRVSSTYRPKQKNKPKSMETRHLTDRH